jgi:hypothetical protein
MQNPKENLYMIDAKMRREWLRTQLEIEAELGRLYVNAQSPDVVNNPGFTEQWLNLQAVYGGGLPSLNPYPRMARTVVTSTINPSVISPEFTPVSTKGRTMRPTALFGKCVCHVCKLAEMAGKEKQKHHCIDCGFCMFVLCPKTFDNAWDPRQNNYFRRYSCSYQSNDAHNCERRQRETRRFMLWLCWLRSRRHGIIPKRGLGKLPRVLIKIISKLMC